MGFTENSLITAMQFGVAPALRHDGRSGHRVSIGPGASGIASFFRMRGVRVAKTTVGTPTQVNGDWSDPRSKPHLWPFGRP